MMKQYELLQAHQEVLLALARLEVVLATFEPDDPYRADIQALMGEFRTAIDSIQVSPSRLRIPSATRAVGRRQSKSGPVRIRR